MKNPEISVIICTYNRVKSLSRVLSDLENQSFPSGSFSWELLIVDNNSSDGTKNLINNYAQNTDLPIQYHFESCPGKSYALNTGVKLSKGNILAFTDDDVKISPHWLSEIHRASIFYSSYNCFGGKIIAEINVPLPDWLDENGPSVMFGGPLVKHDRGETIKEYDEKMYVPAGANMFFRKEVFNNYGLFRSDLGPGLGGGEDTEFLFRVKNKGEKILYYPKAIVKHLTPNIRVTKSYYRRYFWHAGRATSRWNIGSDSIVKYFNIPRYLFKQCFVDIIRLVVLGMFTEKHENFFNEIKIIYKLGMIYENFLKGKQQI